MCTIEADYAVRSSTSQLHSETLLTLRAFSEPELRICRAAALLLASHHNGTPKIFEEVSHGLAAANLDFLNILRWVADDGSRSFRVLLPRPMDISAQKTVYIYAGLSTVQ